jgi:hypothetical protein
MLRSQDKMVASGPLAAFIWNYKNLDVSEQAKQYEALLRAPQTGFFCKFICI